MKPLAFGCLTLVFAVACTSAEPTPRTSPGPFEGELVSTDDALPAGFPDEVRIPEPSTVIYSATSNLGSSVYFTSDLARADVERSFLDTFAGEGWTLHTCMRTETRPDPTTLIVASREGFTATVVVGFSRTYADRLEGKRYAFFVSIATVGEPPPSRAEPC